MCSRASISTLSLVFTFCCILHAPELFTGIKALFYFFSPTFRAQFDLAHNKYSIFIVVGTFIYSNSFLDVEMRNIAIISFAFAFSSRCSF